MFVVFELSDVSDIRGIVGREAIMLGDDSIVVEEGIVLVFSVIEGVGVEEEKVSQEVDISGLRVTVVPGSRSIGC